MRLVTTVETNHNFGPPSDVTDGSIGNLPCRQELNDWGGTTFYSVWEPTDAERAAIADGANVRLGVEWIGAFPPVSLGITHLTEEQLPGG